MLVALAVSVSPELAGAAPSASPQAAALRIGQAADLEALVVFEIEACTKKPSCSFLEELIDVVFDGGEDCGPQKAEVELPVAECSFYVDNDKQLGPFVVDAGAFVAPADGELMCESPTTLPPGWVEEARAKAQATGHRCPAEIVPIATDKGSILLSPR